MSENGCSPMETAAKYRAFADECERLARHAVNERHPQSLREMADAWRKLAEVAEQAKAKD
jgi:hypothetical protein